MIHVKEPQFLFWPQPEEWGGRASSLFPTHQKPMSPLFPCLRPRFSVRGRWVP